MELQQVNRTDAEKVFITVTNDPVLATYLIQGVAVEWTATTTAANAGVYVNLPQVASNATTGIAAKIAGVVETTIATGGTGRVQIYGVNDNVRASASIASSRLVVASSINATNVGHVTLDAQTTLNSPEYHGALVGWTVDDSVDATHATVFITTMG